MSIPAAVITRRRVLLGTGALVVSFSSNSPLFGQQSTEAGQRPGGNPPLPGSLKLNPLLDSWIRISADSNVTIFTGKVELGQGIKTALLQVAAEQLDAPFASLRLITADTSLTVNEGFTAGSHSMQDSGTAILHAAAQVRAILMAEAARRFGVMPDQLKTEDGAVIAPDGRQLRYGELVANERLHVEAQPQSPLKNPTSFKIMGKPLPRVDIPAKVTGGQAYVQDFRPPGMVHARVVRPPSYGAKLTSVDTADVEKLPGILKVVRDGNFLAVVAEREFLAIKAMRSLAVAAKWEETSNLPRQADLPAVITALPGQVTAILDRHQESSAPSKKLEATYTRPYQAHGSIGPSCAVAHWEETGLTVWSHTQGVYPARQAIAEMLRLPADRVRCIHMEGSGCYGHNGADDAAADAALIARAVPGRPVRVQWMREQEHTWEPFGPAMVTKVSAALDDSGSIVDWSYDVWSNTHSMRPGGAGALLAGQSLAQAFPVPAPRAIPQPEGGGDRNAIPLYRIPNARVVHHFLPTMPLRVSALRALGAYMNIFSIESFIDELAQAAAADPVEFRLRHLDDPRAREVIQTACEHFGWSSFRKLPGRGRGCAFARYKNLAAIARLRLKSRLNAKPAARDCFALSLPLTAGKLSIPTDSSIRSKAPSCSQRAGRCTKASASITPA